jgi:hypothetical protein
MASSKKKQVAITKNEYYALDECDCGKAPFKYHDVTKNVYIAKCANVKYDLDLKTKKWTLSKKQPCALNCVYHAERPVFKQIENTIINTIKCKPFTLEDRLRSLFRFLYLTDRTTVIQEIDIIVEYTLKRKPRKIYYFPSTTGHPRISHRESFKDYETRIFSEKIVDRSEPVIKEVPIIINEPVIEIDSESGSGSDSESSDSEAGSEAGSEVDPDVDPDPESDPEPDSGLGSDVGSEIGGFEQEDCPEYDDPGDDYDYTDD